MITVRKAAERGRSQTDWLNSQHTFSFADYVDAKHMGFGKLRVINDDVVGPARGFGRHPHRDMEILSYVLEGSLRHDDSMGNGSVIRPGQGGFFLKHYIGIAAAVAASSIAVAKHPGDATYRPARMASRLSSGSP